MALRVVGSAAGVPPPADGLHRERGSVVVGGRRTPEALYIASPKSSWLSSFVFASAYGRETLSIVATDVRGGGMGVRGGYGWGLGSRTSLAVHTVSTTVGGAAAKATLGVHWVVLMTEVALWGAGILGAVAGVFGRSCPCSGAPSAGLWWWVLLRVGVTYLRYASHFVKVYGSYDNPYLNREERLDLRSTYVPLSFRGGDDEQHVQPAAQVLADLGKSRTVIVGSPGSGKSTLLQAHGVGVLDSLSLTSRRARVIPFLVRMRDLATFLEPDMPRTLGGNVIADYLVREILVKEEFFRSAERAARFLRHTLTSGSTLVMLDGLDEVPDAKLGALLSAVDDFITDGNKAHPTKRARILLTCRSQNFDLLRDGWIDSAFAPYDLYALAPLADRDIMAYLNKFGYQQRSSTLKNQPPLFRTGQGPQRFFDAIREDEKIDLLRVPLILAMAVSLYAEAPELIPATIGKLYQDMIEEMLDRHSFRANPGEASLAPSAHGRRVAVSRTPRSAAATPRAATASTSSQLSTSTACSASSRLRLRSRRGTSATLPARAWRSSPPTGPTA